MFADVGKKIKLLVTISVIVLSVFFVVFGVRIIFLEESSSADRLGGLLIAVIGPLLSWTSGFLTYGFGEIVDKVCSIERTLDRLMAEPPKIPTEILVDEPDLTDCEGGEDDPDQASFYNPIEEKNETKNKPSES